jgi:asparagine synthase (glutamine-hydrolysing)
MCGIAGIWNVATPQPLARVHAMLEAMKHRGPDGQGTLEFQGGAAGMVRLALVDLSSRGQQPLWSEDRRVAILFNGEAYDFRTQRKRLEGLGHRFHTTTDTEVVLKLYLEHGLDFHKHVRGMYGLAIFDWRHSRPGGAPQLLLARGPLGIKHLYVSHPDGDRNRVVFASEIRGMLASRLVAPEVNLEALAGCLSTGCVLQPDSAIAGVRMLEPATFELYRPGEPVLHQQLWRMPAYDPKRETLAESAQRLRARLEESVALHAMADAPVGAFLSGGIDSTGIVSLMRPHVRELRTYTLRFPDVPGGDESAEAAGTALRFDCRHTEVEVTADSVAAILPRFATDLDQPSADGLNTWLISQAAARDVKGVLSGVGGDEWFSGYPVARRMARLATTMSGRLQQTSGEMAHRLVDWVPPGKLQQRMLNLSARRSPLALWLQSRTAFPARTARAMLGLSGRADSVEMRLKSWLSEDSGDWQGETPVGLACLLDTRVFMVHQLLRDADAASMAHSLELRVPLVDLSLVEFARTCSDDYRLSPDGGADDRYLGSGAKRVLIEALRDLLPPTIAERRKKGFTLPIQHWMQNGLQDLIEDTCGEASVRRRGLLDPDLVANARRAMRAGASGAAYPCLWTVMILELWCRGVLDAASHRTVDSGAVGV